MTLNAKGKRILVLRTPQFDRCLNRLRREKGGAAAMAAKKADEFISSLARGDEDIRKKFSFTYNGEYRIRNCRKIDLVAGYRIVLLKKEHYVVLLYVGSHDDCFRRIERQKGLKCDMGSAGPEVVGEDTGGDPDELPGDVLGERIFVQQYEDALVERLDDNLLHRTFSGWRKGSWRANKSEG